MVTFFRGQHFYAVAAGEYLACISQTGIAFGRKIDRPTADFSDGE
jgi:hypothetical protein